MNKLIFLVLIIGIIYRLILTSDGNFIFNMDNARDMVDVREVVVLGKMRLIGPTSAIDGFYNGPAWYYLLAIPFILSGGNPYASILMEIVLWAIGAYFLFKLVSKWSLPATFFVLTVWVTSNLVLLSTAYAFNPNPVMLLTPLLIYLMAKFIETKKIVYSLSTFTLAALFFHFEMNAGVFLLPVIVLTVILSKNINLLKTKIFILGLLTYFLLLSPQIIFDIKHDFIMAKSVISYLSSAAYMGQVTSPIERVPLMYETFYDAILPTFANFKQFVDIFIALFISLVVMVLFKFIGLLKSDNKKDLVLIISLLIIFVPFLSFIFISVGVSRWHLGAVVAAAVLMGGYILNQLSELSKWGKILAFGLMGTYLIFSVINVKNYLTDSRKPSNDPAVFANELAAVDFVYKKADGKSFKVYSYLPSVIDYPYQYLIWWRGLDKYGYTPEDYAYAPNKPPYIAQKERLETGEQRDSSGLIYLIKQPDETGRRHLWENTFKHLELLSTEKVGPLIIEIRKEEIL